VFLEPVFTGSNAEPSNGYFVILLDGGDGLLRVGLLGLPFDDVEGHRDAGQAGGTPGQESPPRERRI
jgi:hypothetical protein